MIESLKDYFKIVSVNCTMFGFTLSTADAIKLGIIESTDLGSLIGFSKIYINGKFSVSLNIIGLRWNYTCQDW